MFIECWEQLAGRNNLPLIIGSDVSGGVMTGQTGQAVKRADGTGQTGQAVNRADGTGQMGHWGQAVNHADARCYFPWIFTEHWSTFSLFSVKIHGTANIRKYAIFREYSRKTDVHIRYFPWKFQKMCCIQWLCTLQLLRFAFVALMLLWLYLSPFSTVHSCTFHSHVVCPSVYTSIRLQRWWIMSSRLEMLEIKCTDN